MTKSLDLDLDSRSKSTMFTPLYTTLFLCQSIRVVQLAALSYSDALLANQKIHCKSKKESTKCTQQ